MNKIDDKVNLPCIEDIIKHRTHFEMLKQLPKK